MGQSGPFESSFAPAGCPEQQAFGNHAVEEAYQFTPSQLSSYNVSEQLPAGGNLGMPPLDYGTGWNPPGGPGGGNRCPWMPQPGAGTGWNSPGEPGGGNGYPWMPQPDAGTGWSSTGEAGSGPVPNFIEYSGALVGGNPVNELPKLLADGTLSGQTHLSGDQQTQVSGIEKQYNQSEHSTEQDLKKQEGILRGEMMQDDLGLGIQQTENAINKDEKTLNHDYKEENSQIWSVLNPDQQWELKGAMHQVEVQNAPPKPSTGGWPNLGPCGV